MPIRSNSFGGCGKGRGKAQSMIGKRRRPSGRSRFPKENEKAKRL